MMKQKITIKVQLNCDKCRSKALKIAAVAKGVSSVALEGDDRDKVVVIGEGTDSVCLAKALRKKFKHANIQIQSVEEVKDEKEKEKKKEDEKLIIPPIPYYYPTSYPHCIVRDCQYDQYGSGCIVM